MLNENYECRAEVDFLRKIMMVLFESYISFISMK